jgi:hypothetical protein
MSGMCTSISTRWTRESINDWRLLQSAGLPNVDRKNPVPCKGHTTRWHYGASNRESNVRSTPVTVDGFTYRFVTLTPHRFFGYQTICFLGEEVNMAEREETIADGFDHRRLAGGVLEPAKGSWMELLGLGNEWLLSELGRRSVCWRRSRDDRRPLGFL